MSLHTVIDTSKRGEPEVTIPLRIHLDMFDGLRQGMVGVFQLIACTDGAGGWTLGMGDVSTIDEVAATHKGEEADGEP